ncbi:carbohydrate kinase [Paenarthrobacter sp. GOM3]|uniref:carbohydrate kinase family protein n=1 Tax=Paenarthrobacter sp. GOM3 TaxID=2782567 RepID=UPI001BA6001E|nr:carbohydrate kinase [Paenarthrobacter sp. GOM3]WOH20575.1 carbohydrate kinase [Paenarthrobacter sp. GOM3]
MGPSTTGKPQSALDVLVIGEALIDVVTAPSGQVEHPGGSPANVAYGLGRLGVFTGLLTAIGDDARGTAIEAHLHSAGVTVLPGSRSLARTSAATVTLAADGSAAYDFDVTWDLPRTVLPSLPKVLHTGSIATFLAPGARNVKSILERAHHRCTVTYDPNIRPALLGSHTEAVAIFEDLVPATDLVKLSDEDAQWLYPHKSHNETAAHIIGLGAKLAVVTMGASGSHFASAEASIDIPAPKTMVVDTIGAGDSFMSALILGLLNEGRFTRDAMSRMGEAAAAAAAVTVSRAGANPPTLAELDRVLLG